MSERRDESDLLRQVAAGDHAALSGLLLVHYDSLRRHIDRRIAGDLQGSATADDILHQTVVRAAQGIRGYQARGVRAFRAWLKTIADNLIKDAQRRRRRERRAAEQGGPFAPRGAGSSWGALAAMPPRRALPASATRTSAAFAPRWPASRPTSATSSSDTTFGTSRSRKLQKPSAPRKTRFAGFVIVRERSCVS